MCFFLSNARRVLSCNLGARRPRWLTPRVPRVCSGWLWWFVAVVVVTVVVGIVGGFVVVVVIVVVIVVDVVGIEGWFWGFVSSFAAPLLYSLLAVAGLLAGLVLFHSDFAIAKLLMLSLCSSWVSGCGGIGVS